MEEGETMISRRNFIKSLGALLAMPKQTLAKNDGLNRRTFDNAVWYIVKETGPMDLDARRAFEEDIASGACLSDLAERVGIEFPYSVGEDLLSAEVESIWYPWGTPYDMVVGLLPGAIYYKSNDGGVTFTERCVVE